MHDGQMVMFAAKTGLWALESWYISPRTYCQNSSLRAFTKAYVFEQSIHLLFYILFI